jgi:GNAT superfamily N-acetyltransferase
VARLLAPGRASLSPTAPRDTIRLFPGVRLEQVIKQYALEQGALEIQYIEEFFGEFPRKKTAAEIVERLCDREHLIHMIETALPDEPGQDVPVAFKVGHEIRADEGIAKLADLVKRLDGAVQFEGRKVLYAWIGGTRRDWRGQGFFRALSEEQEAWALANGFHEIVVKTKNKFYEMRGTLDHLRFEVVKFEPHRIDNAESKVYLSKKLDASVLKSHKSARTVVRA